MPDPNDAMPEGQDQAEVFDEENITADGRDVATSDMQRDVYDMTSAARDASELDPEADFDPDASDAAEFDEVVMADESLDEPRTFARDEADLIASDGVRPADFEPERLADDDLEALGYDGDEAVSAEADAALDEGLEETFPASDPVSISRRSG